MRGQRGPETLHLPNWDDTRHLKIYTQLTLIQLAQIKKMASMLPVLKVACILQIKVQVDPKDRDPFLGLVKPIFHPVSAEPECAYVAFHRRKRWAWRISGGLKDDKGLIYECNNIISHPIQVYHA